MVTVTVTTNTNSFKQLKEHFIHKHFSLSNVVGPVFQFSFHFCVVMHRWTLSVVSAAIVNFNCNVMLTATSKNCSCF